MLFSSIRFLISTLIDSVNKQLIRPNDYLELAYIQQKQSFTEYFRSCLKSVVFLPKSYNTPKLPNFKNFKKMKNWILFLVFSCIVTISFAQKQGIEIQGKVIEGETQQPVEFATIMIGDNETKKPITGATTDEKGNFKLRTKATNFYIEISFIGFTNKTITEFDRQNQKINLGTIVLSTDSETLDEVVVRAEKSSTEFKLDKRVFNVGKDLSNTGASALEVLNNVPSVNVDIEGEISLRGSQGVQVLINGKPSVIANESGNALGTITAEMIEKIEVITNPSAKYDAEGTSGIINIVIKKEEKKGINGSVTVNTGFPNNHSVGLSLNRRTEKFNLFSQIGAGYRTFPSESEGINKDLRNNTTINSLGNGDKNENFYNFVLGTDYHINDLSVITLSGSFAYEVESEFSNTNFRQLDASQALVSEWNRVETTEATNPKFQYELQYKKDFKDNKEHSLLMSATGRSFAKDQTSEFDNSTVSGANRNILQDTRTDFKNANYTFKIDYTKPYSDKFTLETGAQYDIGDVANDFAVNEQINGEWVNDANLTNIFDFNQKVLGAYSTAAYEGDKAGLKLGLRLENTDLNTLLENTNEKNSQNYTNLFPSVHTSYKLTENFSLQAGYSRRIFRPRLWDLNPFFNIRNNFSIRTGNPNLQPQFTDSYELNSIYIVGKTSMNFGIYHRYTTDVVERVATFLDNVSTTQPFNIGTERTTGLEFNAKYSPTKWFTINGDINYNYFNRQGTYELTSFDFNADQWSSKVTTKFKLPAKIDLEITGHYRSSYKTFQSIRSGNAFADLGLRKKIMNGKAIINLSIRDVFASRFFENETTQDTFYLYSRRQRGRFTTLGISFGFGKGEAMEFAGEKGHRGGGRRR